MPFDTYSDVILTRDVAERGFRTGDVGTVVERHALSGVSEDGYSVEFFRHDRQYGWRGHAAGERPTATYAGRSARGSGSQRLRRPI